MRAERQFQALGLCGSLSGCVAHPSVVGYGDTTQLLLTGFRQ
jgi:hypothetical protein